MMKQVKYLVLFCVLFPYNTCEGGVSKEYQFNPISDESSKYYLSDLKVTYYDALQMCYEKDMQLVSIQTKRKNKEIFEFLKGTDEALWTSGTKTSRGLLPAKWLNGEFLEFNNFKTSLYFDHSSYCIEVNRISNELVWHKQICDKKLRFICEKLREEVTNPKCEDYNEDLVHGNTLIHKKYYIGREIITYSKALQTCRSMCMRLVSIESVEKNQDLFEAFVAANATEIFWSSGHFKPENVWKWNNGKVATFFSWNHGEPNNAREDEYCVEILQNGNKVVWNDQPCEDKRMYVCETIDKEDQTY